MVDSWFTGTDLVGTASRTWDPSRSCAAGLSALDGMRTLSKIGNGTTVRSSQRGIWLEACSMITMTCVLIYRQSLQTTGSVMLVWRATKKPLSVTADGVLRGSHAVSMSGGIAKPWRQIACSAHLNPLSVLQLAWPTTQVEADLVVSVSETRRVVLDNRYPWG